MLKRAIILILLILMPVSRAAGNADQLVGTWHIYDSTNTLIDSIEITVVVSKKNISRFSYKQASHLDLKENSLQGYLFGNYIVFDLINMGYAQTYIAEIDFDNDSGPGVEVKTKLANCTVVGQDTSLVKKKFSSRLAADSAQCDASSFHASDLADIKFVKDGADINLVSTDNSPSDSTVNKESKFQNRIEGIWSVAGSQPSLRRRIVIKDLAAHHLGYSFTYRLLNNSTSLGNVSEVDFETANRHGFIVNNYMMINTTRFDKPDELLLLKLNTNTLKSGSGKELSTTNADCFPLKNPDPDVMICTPNDSSSKTTSTTSRYGRRKANKVETNLSIDF